MLSLCLTVYNRADLIMESFQHVINDERISEIIIVDDHSDEAEYERMAVKLADLNSPKIRLFRNASNLGVYDNKHRSVELASNEYVIIFDSDNILPTAYLDVIFAHKWQVDVILAPSFARPSFDYRDLKGKYNRKTIRRFLKKRNLACCLNTMNYFINRQRYLDVWEPAPDILGADSIHFNYLWLKANGSIWVVDELEYEHRILATSHYVLNAVQSDPLCKREFNLITALSKH